MKTRIITGGLLALVAVLGILSAPSSFFAAVVAIVLALAVHEWLAMCKFSLKTTVISLFLFVILCFFLWAGDRSAGLIVLIAGFSYWLIKLALLKKPQTIQAVKTPVEAVFVALVCWYSLVLLHSVQGHGHYLALGALLTVWCADSFAYFGGKQWGKTKLVPSISPGKTWEGVMSGTVAAVVISGVFFAVFTPAISGNASGFLVALIAACTALISVVGDLAESKFKRAVGVKDSGNILPGHGGVYDRVDGVLAGLPVFVFLWWVFIGPLA